MTKLFKINLIACFSAILLQIAPAWAEDLALVVNNRNYRQQANTDAPANIRQTVNALENAGYRVIALQNATAAQSRAALEQLAQAANSTDRLLIVLSGHFVHSPADSWLLPTDRGLPALANVYYNAISMNVILSLMAQHPGEAALFLGQSTGGLSLGGGLDQGLGQLHAPQGVFIAKGNPVAINAALSGIFLQPGIGLASASAQAGSEIEVSGFVSDVTQLGAAGTAPHTQREEVVWALAMALNTAESYDGYLLLFPNGRYVSDAANRKADLIQADYETRAKQAEDALQLSARDRRAVQENLTLLGYNTWGIDGIFGQGTRQAIASWQQNQGLESTGYLKAAQIQRLDRQGDARRRVIEREERQKREEALAQDRAFWRDTGARGDLSGLKRYVNQYPNGLYAAAARAKIRKIEQDIQDRRRDDRAFWQSTGANGTINGINAYLARYPNGLFASFARREIIRLQKEKDRQDRQIRQDRDYWHKTGAKGTVAGLQQYLGAYPQGLYAQQARALLKEIKDRDREQQKLEEQAAWDQAKAQHTVAAYRAYLQRYPGGRFADRARNRIAKLNDVPPTPGDLLAAENRIVRDRPTRRVVEARLERLGFMPGKIDGVFEDKTRKAIRRYQRKLGLPVTGYIDQMTFVQMMQVTD